MDISGEVVFLGVFGVGLVLAGGQAMVTGEMKLPRRFLEKQRYLRGGWATFMGLGYVGWGIFLCVNGLQWYQKQHPIVWEQLAQAFQWHKDTSTAILLGITFGLIFLSVLLGYMLPQE